MSTLDRRTANHTQYISPEWTLELFVQPVDKVLQLTTKIVPLARKEKEA